MSDTLQRTLDWFKKIIPNDHDTARKGFHTQLGVHFEEVGEMVIELSTDSDETAALLNSAHVALHNLAEHLKRNGDAIHIDNEDLPDFFDAICDQIVTGAGLAAYIKGDLTGALSAVNRSNYSKFVNGEPIFDENRKVKKGPDYVKADLSPFLPA